MVPNEHVHCVVTNAGERVGLGPCPGIDLTQLLLETVPQLLQAVTVPV